MPEVLVQVKVAREKEQSSEGEDGPLPAPPRSRHLIQESMMQARMSEVVCPSLYIGTSMEAQRWCCQWRWWQW